MMPHHLLAHEQGRWIGWHARVDLRRSVVPITDELGHVIREWDDLDWIHYEGADGLRLCPIRVDPNYDTTVVAMDYSGGFTIEDHWHPCSHIEVVLEGELDIDGRSEPAGSIRFVPGGTTYGIVVGGDGAKVLEIFPSRHVDHVGGHFTDPEVAARMNDNLDRKERMSRVLGLEL
jgi:hypothetical protein